MRGFLPGDEQVGIHLGLVRGDAIAQILVSIILREIELVKEPLSLVDLYQPRIARRVTHLLFFKLPNCGILVM